jgi:hypothetical protein
MDMDRWYCMGEWKTNGGENSMAKDGLTGSNEERRAIKEFKRKTGQSLINAADSGWTKHRERQGSTHGVKEVFAGENNKVSGELKEGDSKKVAKDNKPILRNLKGWKGYVWNYKNMVEKFDEVWDDIEWGTGTKPKSEEKVTKGAVEKTIIKF